MLKAAPHRPHFGRCLMLFSCLPQSVEVPNPCWHSRRPTKQETELVTKRLFVGGLAWATDENALRTAFERFGEVTAAAIITDPQTGKSRGFGFITYSDGAAADRAIEELNGSDLDGRRIAVNVAQDRPRGPRPGGGGPRPPREGGGFSSGGGFGGGAGRPQRGSRDGGGGGFDSAGGRGGKRGGGSGKRGGRSRDDYDDY